MIKPSELLLPENDWREVKHGRWLEIVPKGFGDGIIMGNIFSLLSSYVRSNDVGYVLLGGLHYILREENGNVITAYVPDVTFLRQERVLNINPHDVFHGTPDLAVEVASPDESHKLLREKVQDYFTAGTEEVWLIYPLMEQMICYGRENNATLYTRQDVLESKTLFPGLKILVAEFFAE